MIYADLLGKQSVPEDVFTSNCLGLLSLLPDRDLLHFISMARTCRSEQLPLPVSEQSKVTIDFWPYLRGCIPDAILTVDAHQLPTFKVIVEIKIGSQQTVDQLARYWRAGNVLYNGNFALIYITHHPSIPIEELQSSEADAGPTSKIYWLSWYELFLWTHRLISAESSRLGTTEGKILRMLRFYLGGKGYRTFLGWTPPISTCAALPYSRTYSLSVRPTAQRVTGYARSYMAVGIGLTSCIPYISQSKELF